MHEEGLCHCRILIQIVKYSYKNKPPYFNNPPTSSRYVFTATLPEGHENKHPAIIRACLAVILRVNAHIDLQSRLVRSTTAEPQTIICLTLALANGPKFHFFVDSTSVECSSSLTTYAVFQGTSSGGRQCSRNRRSNRHIVNCMPNLTVYLLKVSNSRRVDCHLRYPRKLRRPCLGHLADALSVQGHAGLCLHHHHHLQIEPGKS